jgi:hypothetical protein
MLVMVKKYHASGIVTLEHGTGERAPDLWPSHYVISDSRKTDSEPGAGGSCL